MAIRCGFMLVGPEGRRTVTTFPKYTGTWLLFCSYGIVVGGQHGSCKGIFDTFTALQ